MTKPTSFRLPDHIHIAAKRYAALHQIPLAQVVIRALRDYLPELEDSSEATRDAALDHTDWITELDRRLSAIEEMAAR